MITCTQGDALMMCKQLGFRLKQQHPRHQGFPAKWSESWVGPTPTLLQIAKCG